MGEERGECATSCCKARSGVVSLRSCLWLVSRTVSCAKFYFCGRARKDYSGLLADGKCYNKTSGGISVAEAVAQAMCLLQRTSTDASDGEPGVSNEKRWSLDPSGGNQRGLYGCAKQQKAFVGWMFCV